MVKNRNSFQQCSIVRQIKKYDIMNKFKIRIVESAVVNKVCVVFKQTQ